MCLTWNVCGDREVRKGSQEVGWGKGLEVGGGNRAQVEETLGKAKVM